MDHDHLLQLIRTGDTNLVFTHLAYLSPVELYQVLHSFHVKDPVRLLFNRPNSFLRYHNARMRVADSVEWIEEDIIEHIVSGTLIPFRDVMLPINYWQLWMCAYKAVHEDVMILEFKVEDERYIFTLEVQDGKLFMRLSVRGNFRYNTSRRKEGLTYWGLRTRQNETVQRYRDKSAVVEFMGRITAHFQYDEERFPSNTFSRMTRIYAGTLSLKNRDLVPKSLFKYNDVPLPKLVLHLNETDDDKQKRKEDERRQSRWWFAYKKAVLAYIVFQFEAHAYMPWTFRDRGQVFLQSCVVCDGAAFYLSNNETPVCGRECQSKILS